MASFECKHSEKCHYAHTLNLKENSYLYFDTEDEDRDGSENLCIFHSKTLQERDPNFFRTVIRKYAKQQNAQQNKVIFKDTTFYHFAIDTSVDYDSIELEKVIFECCPDFDKLKCENLIIDDCSFNAGGRFKRVQIDTLKMSTKKVEQALVFEVGKYAKDGLLEDENGYINKVDKYTNHVDGKGKVFFVGMNFEKEANFTNTMLEQVVFQNCDLKKVRFLNAHVDNTEFRNCVFPKNSLRSNFDELEKSFADKYKFQILLVVAIVMYYLFKDSSIGSIHYILMMPIVMYLFGSFMLYIIHWLNKIFSLYYDHICTYDEIDIYNKMDELKINNNDEKREQIKDTLMSLSSLYLSFQRNFESKNEIQKGGNFFYSRRYVGLLSLRANFQNMIERSIIIFHFAVNGFGERIARPIFLLTFITLISLFCVNPNEDFIATKATPYYLLENNNTISNKNTTLVYTVVDLNKSSRLFGIRHSDTPYSIVVPKLKADNNTIFDSDELNNRAFFVLSKYIGFVTPANKTWYKSITLTAQIVTVVIGTFSWFLIGAFVLAVRNRIRRK